MPAAYSYCENAARLAGEKHKEVMYGRKCLEAAAAISNIFERNMIKARQAEARKMADLKEMMELFGLTL